MDPPDPPTREVVADPHGGDLALPRPDRAFCAAQHRRRVQADDPRAAVVLDPAGAHRPDEHARLW